MARRRLVEHAGERTSSSDIMQDDIFVEVRFRDAAGLTWCRDTMGRFGLAR